MRKRPKDDVPSIEELDQLSTDELRRAAFERAEQRHDIGFFWDVVRHLSPSEPIAAQDASSGNITGGLTEVAEIVHEMLAGGYGDMEPLLRARFISYIHGDG